MTARDNFFALRFSCAQKFDRMRRILYEISSANATKQALVEIRLKEWPKADARNTSSPLQFRHALGDKRSQSLAILAWILSVKSLLHSHTMSN